MSGAYLIALVRVRDQARFDRDYAAHMEASISPYGGRYLAREAPVARLEGRIPPGKAMLIAFPDMARATAWYGSAGYRALLAIRRAAATTVLGIFEGLAPETLDPTTTQGGA